MLDGLSDAINTIPGVLVEEHGPFQLVVVAESQLYLNSPDKVVEVTDNVFGGNNLMELMLNGLASSFSGGGLEIEITGSADIPQVNGFELLFCFAKEKCWLGCL